MASCRIRAGAAARPEQPWHLLIQDHEEAKQSQLVGCLVGAGDALHSDEPGLCREGRWERTDTGVHPVHSWSGKGDAEAADHYDCTLVTLAAPRSGAATNLQSMEHCQKPLMLRGVDACPGLTAVSTVHSPPAT